jgi:LysM repeat protein
MYYNSNKSNNDYYNAYKEEMESVEEYEKEYSIEKIIKIGLTLLIVGGASILTLYYYNYLSSHQETTSLPLSRQMALLSESKKGEEPPKIEFSTNILPQSIQLQESSSQNLAQIKLNATDSYRGKSKEEMIKKEIIEVSNAMSQKDIALIVEIIISQMNHKKSLPLEQQLGLAEQENSNRNSLKESNHYNKVVVSEKKDTHTSDKQILLREELSVILDNNKNNFSTYETAIKKELPIRSNEMRIIVVQKGDTLSEIAKKAYGDRDAYPKIFTANPEVLKNPDEIFEGQRLRIPA